MSDARAAHPPGEARAADTAGRDDAPTTARAGLPRSLAILLGAAGAVVALAGLHAIASLFAPAFLALTLVVCVHPLLRLLVRHGWPGWLAVTVCVVVLYVIVLALIVAVVLSIARFAQELIKDAGLSTDLQARIAHFLARHGVSSAQAGAALAKIDPSSVLSATSSLLGALVGSLTSIALLGATALFMVADALALPRQLAAVQDGHPHLVQALEDFAAGVRRYWLVATVFGLIVAVLDTAALFWIGVPLALVWGLLSFLTNFIPNVGFVLGLIPPAVLAVVDGSWAQALLVVVVYIVLNVVIQSIIQPRFTGNAVGLTVTWSFLSLVLWGFVLGPLGGLLALPMSLFVKSVLVDADPQARWIGNLISTPPRPADRASKA